MAIADAVEKLINKSCDLTARIAPWWKAKGKRLVIGDGPRAWFKKPQRPPTNQAATPSSPQSMVDSVVFGALLYMGCVWFAMPALAFAFIFACIVPALFKTMISVVVVAAIGLGVLHWTVGRHLK